MVVSAVQVTFVFAQSKIFCKKNIYKATYNCRIVILTSFLDDVRSIEDDFFSVLDFSETFDGVLLAGVEYSFSDALYAGTVDILGGLLDP